MKTGNVYKAKIPNEKVKAFHQYLKDILNKYFPEKVVTISNLDKTFMTPNLKNFHRQMQRELYKKGKTHFYNAIYKRPRNRFLQALVYIEKISTK